MLFKEQECNLQKCRILRFYRLFSINVQIFTYTSVGIFDKRTFYKKGASEI